VYRLAQEISAWIRVPSTARYLGLDPVGNRSLQTSSVSAIPNGKFTYGANDRLSTGTYDNNGNTNRLYRYAYSNCTIDRLADTLLGDRPILNRTGVTGRYDIKIFATPEFKMRDTSEPGDIRFLDAVRKLGLRLVPQNAPVEVIVINHIDPKPSPN
jgi:uncharacterized protein (TIGR03435 family)